MPSGILACQYLHMNNRSAIFLDRDGVIIKNRDDYVKNINEVDFLPNVINNIKKLSDEFLIVVITNQSAINRGLTTHNNVIEIHKMIRDIFYKSGISISGFYYCPHRPDENCICRKPKLGLLLQAVNDLQIDVKSSWLIGDSDSDIQAGIALGCTTIKIERNSELNNAVRIILESLQSSMSN